MRIYLPQQPDPLESRTRGVGAYTRELTDALKANYPSDQFITGGQKGAKVDLVHYPFFDPYFLTLPLRRSLPTIVTVHDAIPLKFAEHFPAGYRGRLKLMLQKRALSTVEHVITDSQASAADIKEYLGIGEDRISVIPLAPGLERSTQTISSKVREEYNLPSRFILYVGDINWNKNVPGLISAFGKLADSRTHLVLVGKVFGDAPDIPQYQEIREAIAQSGRAKLIHQVGYVPQHHLPLFYRLATLYVQPSWYEGFGLSVLEAMNQGCPVVTSNRGSLPEVAGDAAIYFDPGKKGELAARLQELLTNPAKRKSLSALGLQQSKKFSWDTTAKLTHAVYQQILFI